VKDPTCPLVAFCPSFPSLQLLYLALVAALFLSPGPHRPLRLDFYRRCRSIRRPSSSRCLSWNGSLHRCRTRSSPQRHRVASGRYSYSFPKGLAVHHATKLSRSSSADQPCSSLIAPASFTTTQYNLKAACPAPSTSSKVTLHCPSIVEWLSIA
jgi:hypothetical protein